MGDLTTHFSTSEFRCHGFGRRGHRRHGTTVEPSLLILLEAIRSWGGRPLTIVSGHRCSWWNERVGGVSLSQHLITRAADIPKGYIREFEAMTLGARGIGLRDGWVVHVDTRVGSRAVWEY